jgi:hypothetical protein
LRTYTILSKHGPVGAGASASEYIGIVTIAKRYRSDNYTVLNEYICGKIAQLLHLPVPPFMLVRDGQDTWFASAGFTTMGQMLPPIDPKQVAQDVPHIATGVVLFDVLVVNADRHAGNLAYVQATKQLHVFDHSHALFRERPRGEGLSWLRSCTDKLGITVADGAVNRQCLMDYLGAATSIAQWSDRMVRLDDGALSEVFEEARELGLATSEADEALQFLLRRKVRIQELVTRHQFEFKGMLQGGLGNA